jgi:transposase-like protein
MEKGYHKGQELTTSDLGLRLEELSNQPLELFAREGARLVLAVALEEEVAGFLQRQRYERSHGSRRGYCNGHRERQISCGAGEFEVAMPRVSDTEQGFHSQLLETWQRRSKLLEGTIPLLYVEGLSTRDFKRALKPLWGKSGLSHSSISRANEALKEAFNNWRHRGPSLEEIVYLFLDGIYLGVRGNSRERQAVLVAHGINHKGKRVVLHLSLGAGGEHGVMEGSAK